MRKESTYQDTRRKNLADKISNKNNGFGSQNVGVIMGMLGVQDSGYYGANYFVTSSTHAVTVDNDMDVALSVAHTYMSYST